MVAARTDADDVHAAGWPAGLPTPRVSRPHVGDHADRAPARLHGVVAQQWLPPLHISLTRCSLQTTPQRFTLHDISLGVTIKAMRWWVFAAVVAVIVGRSNLALDVCLFVIGGASAYLISLHLHPFRVCRTCGGTGRQAGAMFPWSHRQCLRCGGQTRHRRWGVQLFHSSHGKMTLAERGAQRARNYRRGAPRL